MYRFYGCGTNKRYKDKKHANKNMLKNKIMKQRLLYVDELKGFAILMVVIGHIFYFSFRIQGEEYISPWSEIIYSFHMPLFAFLLDYSSNHLQTGD